MCYTCTNDGQRLLFFGVFNDCLIVLSEELLDLVNIGSN